MASPSADRVVDPETDHVDRLDADLVQETIAELRDRVCARFPERGISAVADRLAVLADEVEDVSDASRLRLRVTTWLSRLIALAIVAGTGWLLWKVSTAVEAGQAGGPLNWVPLVESVVNDVVFAGVGSWFLLVAPSRLERSRLLKLLHRLRSVAHVIDMHQLNKDPEHLRTGYLPTTASVRDAMDREAMGHYLDYCTELLSLVGKVAALCAEASEDDLILDAVSDIEQLSSDLAGTIRLKIAALPD